MIVQPEIIILYDCILYVGTSFSNLLSVSFIQTLLDLGASPDYKDSRGLTPLYHSSMVGGDPYCCELILHDRANVGCMDENGWQEIHQVKISFGKWLAVDRVY